MTEAMAVETAAFDDLGVRDLYAVLQLRCDVFVVEQECAYAELDGRDTEPGTRHHWVQRDGEVVCAARTLTEDDGSTRIGRVVTASRARGAGLAALVVEHVLATTPAPHVLDAQSHLAEWYRRFGFEVVGDEFVEDGIPHVPMRREHPDA